MKIDVLFHFVTYFKLQQKLAKIFSILHYDCSRTMSDCVSSSDKISTMAWLGGWPLVTKNNETFNQMSGNTSQNQGIQKCVLIVFKLNMKKTTNKSKLELSTILDSKLSALTQDKRVRRTSCKVRIIQEGKDS